VQVGAGDGGARKSTLDPGWTLAGASTLFILFPLHTRILSLFFFPRPTPPSKRLRLTTRRSASGAMSDSAPAPLTGRLVPLRTKDEVRASLETHVVYVVEVPAKHANVVKE
jgi:hypothetical protein